MKGWVDRSNKQLFVVVVNSDHVLWFSLTIRGKGVSKSTQYTTNQGLCFFFTDHNSVVSTSMFKKHSCHIQKKLLFFSPSLPNSITNK